MLGDCKRWESRGPTKKFTAGPLAAVGAPGSYHSAIEAVFNFVLVQQLLHVAGVRKIFRGNFLELLLHAALNIASALLFHYSSLLDA